MKIEKLDFGCSVRGIDLQAIGDRQLVEIKQLLYRNRLVVIKNQKIDEADYCKFAHRFGEPIPYLQANYHHPDHPLIFVSSNVKKDGVQIGVARTGGYWHSDTSFEPDPKIITMLMPKIMPQLHARSTRFIDTAEVYAALPLATRTRLENAQFIHTGRWRYKVQKEALGFDISEILQQIDAAAPPVAHPAVIVHPATGEKGLYANRGFTTAIAGASLDESKQLLGEIFDLAESDRFVREVRWHLGDVIIWDNRFLNHNAGRNSGAEEETMMYRITMKDGLPLSATQDRAKSAA